MSRTICALCLADRVVAGGSLARFVVWKKVEMEKESGRGTYAPGGEPARRAHRSAGPTTTLIRGCAHQCVI